MTNTMFRSNLFIACCLGAMMFLALFLSLVFFMHQSLRLDESQSLWQTSRSVPGIIGVVAQDVHVPLYHLLLRAWEIVFGNSVEVARAFSLAFFIASIPAIYLLGSYAYSNSVGLFAALLTALSPFLNWYGNEIRMYSLFTFLAILNHYWFLRIYREGTRRAWLGYGSTALLGIYTHYFFALLLVTQALFYFRARRRFPEGSFSFFIIVASFLSVALVPWVLFVRQSGGFSNTSPRIPLPASIDVFNAFSQFIFGFQNDYMNTLIVALWPLTMLLIFLALRANRIPERSVYFFLQAVIPLALAFFLSIVITPVFLSRYLIMSVPALYLFLGWLLSLYPKFLARVVGTFFVVGMSLGVVTQAMSVETPAKEEYQKMSDYVMVREVPSDAIFISAPFTIYPFEYYYHGVNNPVTIPDWDQFANGAIPAFTADTLKSIPSLIGSHARVWLLLSYDQGYEGKIKNYFDTHYALLDTQQFSNGLAFYLYRVRYDVPL